MLGDARGVGGFEIESCLKAFLVLFGIFALDFVVNRVIVGGGNGFEGIIRCQAGDLLENVDEVADVVIANIIADVIIAIAAPVKAHIRAGGVFICSGISAERRQDVLDALDAAGYAVLDVCDRGGWCAMAARRA